MLFPVSASDVRCLCACQVSILLVGLEDEFLFVGRLDNLAMSYLSLRALIDSTFGADALAEETAIKAVALFDHEEVGSASAQGLRLALCGILKHAPIDNAWHMSGCY